MGAPAAQPAAPAPPGLTSERAVSAGLHTIKVATRAILISELAVPLACKGLAGTASIPDVSGNTHGTTIGVSDCTWSSAAQQCECTVTFTQRL